MSRSYRSLNKSSNLLWKIWLTMKACAIFVLIIGRMARSSWMVICSQEWIQMNFGTPHMSQKKTNTDEAMRISEMRTFHKMFIKTCVIDAHEGRDVMSMDLPNAFIQTS